MFIADADNNVVRRVDAATQVITTVAGNGTSGFSGDGGPATSGELNSPDGVAVDGSGNLFIADLWNNRIRRVDAGTQTITTVAGNGTTGSGGDGGPATSAELSYPEGVAVDSFGNLFIVASGGLCVGCASPNIGGSIRRVDAATRIITTVAGNGTSGFSGDGGPATSAELYWPTGVAVDGLGNLFIADRFNQRVRRVDAATQNITTVAGSGWCNGSTGGFSGDGGPATGACLNYPDSVSVDGSGNLFIADSLNCRVRRVDAATKIITTAVGGGSGGDGGPATNAVLTAPLGVALDSSGNLFVADDDDNRIRRMDAETQAITTVAGSGNEGFSGDGGPATTANIAWPTAVAVDESGNVFISDSYNSRIRRVDAATHAITTVAGNGTYGYTGDGGPATEAELSYPWGVAVDGSGNVFFADTSNFCVRRVDAITQVIATVAGNGTVGSGGDGGPATGAQLGFAQGVAVDSSGNLFIADRVFNRIRRVDAATQVITTVAGNGKIGVPFGGDGGPATSAQLNAPWWVAVDGSGNLFIADTGNFRVRRVDATTQVIITVAGNGTGAFSGDGGLATSAGFSYPLGVAIDGSGNLFVSDPDSNRVRKTTLPAFVALQPAILSFSNQNLGTASSPQAVTLTNTGVVGLDITSIATSEGFAETDNCGSAVAPRANCTLNITFAPTVAGVQSGAITITDNAFGSPHVISVSGTGVGPDFTLTSAPGSSTAATVAPGGPATYTLSGTAEGGLNQPLAFACTGAPSESTCKVSPNPVTLGTSATNITVTVTTTAPSLVAPRSRPLPPAWPALPAPLALGTIGLLLLGVRCALRLRQQSNGISRWAAATSLAAGLSLALALAGCGGGGGGGGGTHDPGTPAGTYTLKVTGSTGSGSSTLSHSVTLTLTVT